MSIKQIGGKANAAQFLVFQHSDTSVLIKYYSVINRAFRKGDINNDNYALYIDRYNAYKNGYQVYGTQFYEDKNTRETRSYPLKDSINVNKLRKKLGLDSLDLK